MISEDNTRLIITVSKELAAKLDGYCKTIGITRSAMCAYLIGQGILGLDKALSAVDTLVGTMNVQLVSQLAQPRPQPEQQPEQDPQQINFDDVIV